MDDITWDKIYREWRDACESIDSPLLRPTAFEDIVVPCKGTAAVEAHCDWWPRNETVQRRRELPDSSSLSYALRQRTAYQRTAELLWRAKDDLDMSAAIWIGASLWGKMKNPCESWRRQQTLSILQLCPFVCSRFTAIGRWHHSCRHTLPFSVLDNWHLWDAIVPETLEQLIGVVAIEASLVYSNWLLVRILPEGSVELNTSPAYDRSTVDGAVLPRDPGDQPTE